MFLFVKYIVEQEKWDRRFGLHPHPPNYSTKKKKNPYIVNPKKLN